MDIHQLLDDHAALLIIDVQEGFLNEYTTHLPERISLFVQNTSFRHLLLSRFINHAQSPYQKLRDYYELTTSPAIDLVQGFENLGSVFEKSIASSLTPQLLSYLKEHDITTLFLVGMDTNCCVLKTATDLFEQGFRSIILTDLCASSGGPEYHDAALFILARFLGPAHLCPSSQFSKEASQ